MYFSRCISRCAILILLSAPIISHIFEQQYGIMDSEAQTEFVTAIDLLDPCKNCESACHCH